MNMKREVLPQLNLKTGDNGGGSALFANGDKATFTLLNFIVPFRTSKQDWEQP